MRQHFACLTVKMRVLVRGLASSFTSALSSAPLCVSAISLELAHQQHDAYVGLLQRLVRSVTEVPADERHPGGGYPGALPSFLFALQGQDPCCVPHGHQPGPALRPAWA